MVTIFAETIAKDPEEKTDLESFRKDADKVAADCHCPGNGPVKIFLPKIL